MNHANYKIWLQEKLIPHLESKSVTVVNSVSYYNVQINGHQTSDARKGEMLFWLDKHGIRYSSNITKQGCTSSYKCINRNIRLSQLTDCSLNMDTY
jgi:hypothetical protein